MLRNWELSHQSPISVGFSIILWVFSDKNLQDSYSNASNIFVKDLSQLVVVFKNLMDFNSFLDSLRVAYLFKLQNFAQSTLNYFNTLSFDSPYIYCNLDRPLLTTQ